MELQIPEFHQVNSRVSKSLGIFCKHSSVDLEITIQDRSFPIKLTLERKAYSDYFYHQENGNKALALRATLRARGLTTIFLMIFFYYGYEATTPRPNKNPELNPRS